MTSTYRTLRPWFILEILSITDRINLSKWWKYLGQKCYHCIRYDSQSHRSCKIYSVLTALTMHSWQTHDFAKCVPFPLPIFLPPCASVAWRRWVTLVNRGRMVEATWHPLTLLLTSISWWKWSKATTTSAGMRAAEMGAVFHYLCCSAQMSQSFVQLQHLMYLTITMHLAP